jgi:long-subunit acyl-CoA synthetase (AMP-forming)
MALRKSSCRVGVLPHLAVARKRIAWSKKVWHRTSSALRAKVEREVMGMLHDLAKFEMPKKVMLLEKDFTIESGELTPTLKVKRRAVEQHYKELIDKTYAADDPTAAAIEGGS